MTSTDAVARVLQDPPAVHPVDGEHVPGSALRVYGTERQCYELIAASVGPGSVTLETGLGISTALFALLGTTHHCVVGRQPEVDRLTAYFGDRSIPYDSMTFHVGWSDEVLPTLREDGELDLVLIDGGHGFPIPMIDWHYAASRLRTGGVLILDDIQLPAPAMLDDFLRRNPAWTQLERSGKWSAFTRASAGRAHEDHFHQTFLQRRGVVAVARRAARRAKRLVSRARA